MNQSFTATIAFGITALVLNFAAALALSITQPSPFHSISVFSAVWAAGMSYLAQGAYTEGHVGPGNWFRASAIIAVATCGAILLFS